MKTTASTLAAVLATAAVVAVDACGTESEFAVVRRDAIQRRQAAAAARPTDEAGMAQLTDSAQECAMYSYPPVAALVSFGDSLFLLCSLRCSTPKNSDRLSLPAARHLTASAHLE